MTPEQHKEILDQLFAIECKLEALQSDYLVHVAKHEGVLPEDIFKRLWESQVDIAVRSKQK